MNQNINSIDIEEKRKIFLEGLEKTYKKFEKFDKFPGTGFKNRLIRLFFYPNYYFNRFIKGKLSKNKTVILFWGKKINLNTKETSFLSVNGILSGLAEYKLTKFFIKNFKENDIFYDIGANYGFYSFLALEFCKEVHLFEPIPFIFDNLKDNFKDYQNVFLNNIALSDKKGKIDLFIPEGSSIDSMSGSSIIQETTQVHSYQFKKKIEVETETLENYFKSHNLPSVIKLDVEGAESLVIEGGLEFFKNNSPIISLEVWSPKEGGEISMKAVQKLKDIGYQSYQINKNGELEKVDGNLSIIVEKESLSGDNFIFKK